MHYRNLDATPVPTSFRLKGRNVLWFANVPHHTAMHKTRVAVQGLFGIDAIPNLPEARGHPDIRHHSVDDDNDDDVVSRVWCFCVESCQSLLWPGPAVGCWLFTPILRKVAIFERNLGQSARQPANQPALMSSCLAGGCLIRLFAVQCFLEW